MIITNCDRGEILAADDGHITIQLFCDVFLKPPLPDVPKQAHSSTVSVEAI